MIVLLSWLFKYSLTVARTNLPSYLQLFFDTVAVLVSGSATITLETWIPASLSNDAALWVSLRRFCVTFWQCLRLQQIRAFFFLGSVADYYTLPAFIFTGDNNNCIANFWFVNLAICCVPPSYNTSGAPETIFMKSFSRSSLASRSEDTGGLSSLITSAAFSSKRI